MPEFEECALNTGMFERDKASLAIMHYPGKPLA